VTSERLAEYAPLLHALRLQGSRHSASESTLTVWRVQITNFGMNSGALVVDRTEMIKWGNALDVLYGRLPDHPEHGVEKGLQRARECLHPDARWLAALFPSGVAVTRRGMQEVMREQGDDMRAGFLLWKLSVESDAELLTRAAEAGYAPAQAEMFDRCRNSVEKFAWAEKAVAVGDRQGLYRLARCWRHGYGCTANNKRAIELYRQAAELEDSLAMHQYGGFGFGARDWERYHWWGRAAERGYDSFFLCAALLLLVPLFEDGECGRTLHTIGPVIRRNLDVAKCASFGRTLDRYDCGKLERVVELYAAMLTRVRHAIDCWSMAGWLRGLVKDMRVVIAKMAWAEAWRWGDKKHVQKAKRRKRR
jgi:hypothetical protein